jgi:acetolactate decarboxylase
MKTLLATALLTIILIPLALVGCSNQEQQREVEIDRDVLFQASTLDALMVGAYDGDITYGVLKNQGDFGLGTFEGLDGEMVAVDGRFYQVKTDGKAYTVSDEALAPFAMVTYFDVDIEAQPQEGLDYDELKGYIDGILPSQNIFYAVKLDGEFEYVKARSVPAQEKPYPPLSDVIENQTIFEFNDVRGTMVGFWCPSYIEGINAPGYHLHFITADNSAGGHVLELRLGDVTVWIDDTTDLNMVLPDTEEFFQSDLEPKS